MHIHGQYSMQKSQNPNLKNLKNNFLFLCMGWTVCIYVDYTYIHAIHYAYMLQAVCEILYRQRFFMFTVLYRTLFDFRLTFSCNSVSKISKIIYHLVALDKIYKMVYNFVQLQSRYRSGYQSKILDSPFIAKKPVSVQFIIVWHN